MRAPVRWTKVLGRGPGATRLSEARCRTVSTLPAPAPRAGMGETQIGLARVWGARTRVMGTAVHGPAIRPL
jgi:hypothetical protein